jgi:hypothetical protein
VLLTPTKGVSMSSDGTRQNYFQNIVWVYNYKILWRYP